MMSNINTFPVQASILSEQAIKRYIIDKYQLSSDLQSYFYSKSMNDTYYIKSLGKEFYLKASHSSKQSIEQLNRELSIVNYLRDNNLNVVKPVKDRNGNYINIVKAPEGERLLVLYEALEGKTYYDNDSTLQMNFNLGEEIGKIYTLLDNSIFSIDSNLDDSSLLNITLPEIKRSPFCSDREFKHLNTIAQETISKINSLLPKTKPEYGIIHGDFCPAHSIFNKQEVPYLFDFEFVANGWRAYDLSVYLTRSRVWRSSQDCIDERMGRRDSFLEGFSRSRLITDNEIEALNLFVPFHRIWVLGTSLSRSIVKGMAISQFLVNREIDLIDEWIDYYKLI